MSLNPKRLILDLLSTAPRRATGVNVLVRAGHLFGVSENNIRVTLARLRAGGLVDQDEPGQYRLSQPAASVGEHATSWRSIPERVRAWDGSWIGVHTAAVRRSDRRAHRHNDRALRLLGFRALEPSLLIRPDNLAGGIASTRDRLFALGLDPKALVFGGAQFDERTERRARRLWDGAEVRRGYRTALVALQKSAARLDRLPAPAALVESFVLGGRVIRQLVLDPLLPEPMVPADERTALVDAMLHYDRTGRSRWSAFLRSAEEAHNARGHRPHTRQGEAA